VNEGFRTSSMNNVERGKGWGKGAFFRGYAVFSTISSFLFAFLSLP